MLDQYVSWGEAHTNCWMEVDNIFAIVVIVIVIVLLLLLGFLGGGAYQLLDGGVNMNPLLLLKKTIVIVIAVTVEIGFGAYQLLDGGQYNTFAIVEIKLKTRTGTMRI